jgi:uncharacterized membrane protein
MLIKLPLFTLLVAAVAIGTITPLAFAQDNIATIHGTIYELWTFKPLENVMVRVYSDSTIQQQIFATDGTYSLSLQSGSYTITAKYYKGNILLYDTEENITLRENENTTFDLIMFPTFDENEIPENYQIPDIPQIGGAGSRGIWLTLAVVLALAGIGACTYYYLNILSKKKRVGAEKAERSPVKIVGLSNDLKEVMDVIMKGGGRINQVDLRHNLPYSEAKVSLMISDLEDRGLVRRIKKGRGNIIVLN